MTWANSQNNSSSLQGKKKNYISALTFRRILLWWRRLQKESCNAAPVPRAGATKNVMQPLFLFLFTRCLKSQKGK